MVTSKYQLEILNLDLSISSWFTLKVCTNLTLLTDWKEKNFAYAQVGGYFVNAIHAHFVCHLVQNLVNHTVAWINTKMSTYK